MLPGGYMSDLYTFNLYKRIEHWEQLKMNSLIISTLPLFFIFVIYRTLKNLPHFICIILKEAAKKSA